MVNAQMIQQVLPFIVLAVCIACCFSSYMASAKGTDPKTYLPKFLHPIVGIFGLPGKLLGKIPGI